MAEILGNFIEPIAMGECLSLQFSPFAASIKQRWRNHGLPVDFLADYWSTFFPLLTELPPPINQQAKRAIAYIANELLENGLKFHQATAPYPITLSLYLEDKAVRFYLTNSIDPTTIPPLQKFIQTLLTEDTHELYQQQLQANVTTNNRQSHLGFLTMMNDYLAQLAWKFAPAPQQPELIIVTTMVELTVLDN